MAANSSSSQRLYWPPVLELGWLLSEEIVLVAAVAVTVETAAETVTFDGHLIKETAAIRHTAQAQGYPQRPFSCQGPLISPRRSLSLRVLPAHSKLSLCVARSED
jgi:hypothetical protein